MTPDPDRSPAICTACEALYVARVWPDGRILPIGVGWECPCGGEEFRLVA